MYKTTQFIAGDIDKLLDIKTTLAYINILITKQTKTGLYAILPLGYIIQTQIIQIIQTEQQKYGSQVELTNIITCELYQQSGRMKIFANEMFKMENLCLQTTCEENAITTLIENKLSYKHLPKYFFQITKKFRKEIRARNSIIRAYEFYMKDGYSFHTDQQDAINFYEKIKQSYYNIFSILGINKDVISHTSQHETNMLSKTNVEFIYKNKEIIETYTPEPGIEIAHIFYLGTIYGEKFNIQYTNKNNCLYYLHMCSYGIGIYRLIAIYVQQLLNNQLKQELYIFQFCYIPRTKQLNDKIQQIIQKQNSNIVCDLYHINYNKRIQIAKLLPTKYIIYEENNNLFIYNKVLNTIKHYCLRT